MPSPNSSVYGQRRILVALIAICVILLTTFIILLVSTLNANSGNNSDIGANNTQAPSGTQLAGSSGSPYPFSTDFVTETPLATEAPTPEPSPIYNDVAPHDSAKASLFGFLTELMVECNVANTFSSSDYIEFLHNDEYSMTEGVLSFRGSCFRRNPYYGVAAVTDGKLEILWNKSTGSVPKGEGGGYAGSWSGSGWTGQALTVRWDNETKAIMNMNAAAKSKDGLIEVIYATMDGNIYFYDMETGEETRNRIVMGVPFKGAGSIDPRGLPILYIGQGDHYTASGKESKAYAISLIDGRVLATFGQKPDGFSLRSWHAYDSAPIIDGATDTLFYPGENGILYRVKLNTVFDKTAGSLTMNPSQPVKLRYSATRTRNEGYWLGYESSAVAWRNYLYVCDNAGFMQCIDVNTMQTVWVQDIWDDANATPCLEEDPANNTAYLYVGNTLDNKADGNGRGNVAFFKIDACTGEIIWHKPYAVYTSDITGGIMSSAILGQGKISNLVITTLASYGNVNNSGIVIAFDKATGNEVWRFQMNGYAWSSPVALYDAEGNPYIVQCNFAGNIYVLDGEGRQLDCINVESNIEASPVAFDNYIVVGTRIKGIFGIKLF